MSSLISETRPVARKTPRGAWVDPLAFRRLKEWTEAGVRREVMG
jgi:hypothetical protein